MKENQPADLKPDNGTLTISLEQCSDKGVELINALSRVMELYSKRTDKASQDAAIQWFVTRYGKSK